MILLTRFIYYVGKKCESGIQYATVASQIFQIYEYNIVQYYIQCQAWICNSRGNSPVSAVRDRWDGTCRLFFASIARRPGADPSFLATYPGPRKQSTSTDSGPAGTPNHVPVVPALGTAGTAGTVGTSPFASVQVPVVAGTSRNELFNKKVNVSQPLVYIAQQQDQSNSQ